MISTKNSLSFMNVCSLVTISTTENDYGETAQTETLTDVFCAEISIHSARKDSARVQGIRLAKCVVVNSDEYNNELYVKYGDILYTVYDIYLRVDGYTEIVLRERAGDNV